MKTITAIRFVIRNYWKSMVVAIIILLLSTAPGSDFERIPSFPYEDKAVHFLMYFGFTFAVLWDYANRFGLPAMRRSVTPLIVIGLPVIWGGCMELIQQFATTSRSGDWMDELFNTLGATAGFFVAKIGVPLLVKKK